MATTGEEVSGAWVTGAVDLTMGVTKGAVDGLAIGLAEGTVDGLTAGLAEGAVEGLTVGLTEGAVADLAIGTLERTVEGIRATGAVVEEATGDAVQKVRAV